LLSEVKLGELPIHHLSPTGIARIGAPSILELKESLISDIERASTLLRQICLHLRPLICKRKDWNGKTLYTE